MLIGGGPVNAIVHGLELLLAIGALSAALGGGLIG
jgi:hypothetical protein